MVRRSFHCKSRIVVLAKLVSPPPRQALQGSLCQFRLVAEASRWGSCISPYHPAQYMQLRPHSRFTYLTCLPVVCEGKVVKVVTLSPLGDAVSTVRVTARCCCVVCIPAVLPTKCSGTPPASEETHAYSRELGMCLQPALSQQIKTAMMVFAR